MFDMGFIADLRFMLRRMSPYDQRQSMLFSATLSTRVMELCYEHMNNPERFSATPEKMTVDVVDQELYHVSKDEKFGMLLGLLRREAGGHYIIFCNMKSTADRLKLHLNANGFTAAAITGDIPQEKRMKVLATDVASRGLHVDGITHVINYDLPQDAEDYVHRIGRTARAGAGGKAISLACEDYVFSLPDIEEFIKQKIPVLPVTDELVVTDYKTVSGTYRQKSGQYPKKGSPERRRGKDQRVKPAPRQESVRKETGGRKRRTSSRKPPAVRPPQG
jgi:ATP-dependent RNA helicase RhlB